MRFLLLCLADFRHSGDYSPHNQHPTCSVHRNKEPVDEERIQTRRFEGSYRSKVSPTPRWVRYSIYLQIRETNQSVA